MNGDIHRNVQRIAKLQGHTLASLLIDHDGVIMAKLSKTMYVKSCIQCSFSNSTEQKQKNVGHLLQLLFQSVWTLVGHKLSRQSRQIKKKKESFYWKGEKGEKLPMNGNGTTLQTKRPDSMCRLYLLSPARLYVSSAFDTTLEDVDSCSIVLLLAVFESSKLVKKFPLYSTLAQFAMRMLHSVHIWDYRG